eukprot:TRINITY_DN1761_c0_g1_i1.p1 TRINITY_DN1761_c0_g1~~TRINITY_DN1761_c0_g1_i1.p1  ORF type:complete len:601 (-),score=98.41 TRINITY_DN1761_c0_g1_i1:37-1839(-)
MDTGKELFILKAKTKIILTQVFSERDEYQKQVQELQKTLSNVLQEKQQLQEELEEAKTNNKQDLPAPSAADLQTKLADLESTLVQYKKQVVLLQEEVVFWRETYPAVTFTPSSDGPWAEISGENPDTLRSITPLRDRAKPRHQSTGYIISGAVKTATDADNFPSSPRGSSGVQWKRPATPSAQTRVVPSGQLTTTKVSKSSNSNPDEVYTQEGQLKGGTLDCLIGRLASPKAELDYHIKFLLTYRSFCGPEDLLAKLIKLWETAQTLEKYTPRELDVFRLRFVKFLKFWMERHWYDFSEESTTETLQTFINQNIASTLPSSYQNLTQCLNKKLHEKNQKKIVYYMNPPAPVIPVGQITDLLQISTLELARQMSLRDEEIYHSIRPRECMNQAWNKPDLKDTCPNMLRMINRFNLVSAWAQTVIVKEKTLKNRKSLLLKFIKIAQSLRQLHNYHSLMAIIAALESSSVSRLKKTWETIGNQNLNVFEELKELMRSEGNYKNLRMIIKKEDPPTIPYIGVYLSDLTFIEDGNPSRFGDNQEYINYLKMKMLGEVIGEILFYQQERYNLQPVESIQECFDKSEKEALPEKETYKLSLICEPRT